MKLTTISKKLSTYLSLVLITILDLTIISTKSLKLSATESQIKNPYPDSNADTIQVAQTECTKSKKRLWAKVSTLGKDLNVYSKPGGTNIASIPDEWIVVVVKKNKKWTYVTTDEGKSLAGAQNFATGWVETKYLKNYRRSCDKPISSTKTNLDQLLGNYEFIIHEDALQMGDNIFAASVLTRN